MDFRGDPNTQSVIAGHNSPLGGPQGHFLLSTLWLARIFGTFSRVGSVNESVVSCLRGDSSTHHSDFRPLASLFCHHFVKLKGQRRRRFSGLWRSWQRLALDQLTVCVSWAQSIQDREFGPGFLPRRTGLSLGLEGCAVFLWDLPYPLSCVSPPHREDL